MEKHDVRLPNVRRLAAGRGFSAVRELSLVPLVVMPLASILCPGVLSARTWHVPGDVPTIQAAIDLAAAGDDVLVAPGLYAEHDIAMKGNVRVHSEGGPVVTTVDALGLGIGFTYDTVQETTELDGFTIRTGNAAQGSEWEASGGGVRCIGSKAIIRNCIITGCTAGFVGGGISAYETDVEIDHCTVSGCTAYAGGGIFTGYSGTVTITDCRIRGNEGSAGAGGIGAMGRTLTLARCIISGNTVSWGTAGGVDCSSPALAIRDCLVYDNIDVVVGGGTGFYVRSSVGTISGCTVVRNSPWNGGVTVVIQESDIWMEKTIIAFNHGSAIDCSWYAEVNLYCCDFYGNSQGDDFCGDVLGGNFSQDPLFCDIGRDDYTLDARSPCLPGNHPNGVLCGLIGAREEGCGTPVGACCLSDGSCQILTQQECDAQHGSYRGDDTMCVPDPCQPTPARVTTWGRIKADYR